jgi:hypothetical protein
MESEYKNAHDFVTNTGQVLMDEGKAVREIVNSLKNVFVLLCAGSHYGK